MEGSSMDAAKQHIEQIRKDKFWIGVGENPLSKTVRKAVEYLSAELYSKDVHFLMELIQNAEDNEYPKGVEPSLEFLITSRDLTNTGAPATLLIFNNENGFSKKNMESICDVGSSTKAGNRKCGYIGEKGIGFKSVFLLTARPYIFSNGYQICFSEVPCCECNVAYIVPEWVNNNPSVSDIQKIYGPDRTLPTTVLILPLKADKVKPVKEQLSSLHPELLLFLSKIKRLSVKEDNENPAHNTIRAISISTERDFVGKKNIDAESYTVHLTADEEGLCSGGECRYYMWRQRFPVKKEYKVEKRKELEEWAITLAFPFDMRLNRGMSSPGIYAFLPTETFTNLPFIIQADFLLPSSRETILWDNIWNQGILECVPIAFVNAFVSLVRTSEDAPASTLASMFAFLPTSTSSHPKLNEIRELIRRKLLQENIVLSESYSNQKIFHKPDEVGRLKPSFWKVLDKAKKGGVKLHNLSSQGKHILHSSFDVEKYNDVLEFLGVEHVANEWYPRCIQSCNLVLDVGEDIYIELLQFLSVNWTSFNHKTIMGSVPLLKYVSQSGDVSLLSVNEAANQSCGPFLCLSEDERHISWLIEWSKEFGSSAKLFFLPERTQKSCLKVDRVLIWLRDFVKAKTLGVFGFASLLSKSIESNCRMVLTFAHFLYLSFSSGFLSKAELDSLCESMPLLNIHGEVSVRRKGVLVPAKGSKWVELMGGSNAWRHQDYVVLSDEYLHSARYFGHFTPEKELINFLKSHADASDIPDISPPDAAFPTVSGPLTKNNAFSLLDWIRKLRSKGIQMPGKFLNCIKNGSWLKVTMSGSPGYRPPNQSFLSSSSWGSLLQNGCSEMVDIPLVDQIFYGSKISDYKEELKAVGVMFEYSEACQFIGKNLMALASQSNLSRAKVFVMLNFIRFLREKFLSVEEIVESINSVKWVKTSCGGRAPIDSVLYDSDWKSAKAISDIPFVDQDYYGEEIILYKTELNLLGITVGFKENYHIVLKYLKPSTGLNYLKADHLIFALKCMSRSTSSEDHVTAMKKAKCLRTNLGFMHPGECFFSDGKWGCILKIFDGFPFIDENFYGSSIFQYANTLRKIGVVMDFVVASKAVSSKFKQCAKTNSITRENSLSILSCYKILMDEEHILPADLRECIDSCQWLRTRLGDFRSPKECILFDEVWQAISGITLLPFVDDSEFFYGNHIHKYKDGLKGMGVVTDFEAGSHLVLRNIFFPRNIDIFPESVVSLLQCVKNFLKKHKELPKEFLEAIHQTKWLKTTVGYMSPKECLLFDPSHKSSFQRSDGPFIDEEYYGPNISSYKSEIYAIGVNDMSSTTAMSLIASYLKSLSEFAKIERIYDFLSKADWKPNNDAHDWIWVPAGTNGVPAGTNDGVWVTSKECILHDDKNMFSSRFHVLDQYYKQKLFGFFTKAFKIRSRPSVADYCMLWKEWEASRRVISVDECCTFWGHVIFNWNKETEKVASETLSMIPAVSNGSDELLLLKKQDIFLPDDLLLKDLFESSFPYSFFVWCPMRNTSSIPRAKLFEIYSKIGVRKISESVKASELSILDYGELKQSKLSDAFIVKGLGMIILAFLADPSLNIELKSRHEAVKKLLNVKVYVTTKPVKVTYSLQMSSGHDVTATTSQMVRWEREHSVLFTHQLLRSGGLKNVVEYATKFSEVVSQGLLWEKEEQIPRLSELIKFGFLMEFEEDAVSFFLKSKNLQIFMEDEEFLLSVFPSC